ncbi:WASH complex subunit CCDC53 homolog isoform X1 [Lates japonicus]
MEASWLLVALSATVVISIVLLAVVCLDCWKKGPESVIRERNASDEYIPSNQFRVIHPSQPTSELNSSRSAPHLLSPSRIMSSSDPGTQRRQRSFTPTETESNPSYENPPEDPPYVNPDPNHPDSDVEDPGYIIVIPDGEAVPTATPSRASSPSSDGQHDYENIQKEMEPEEKQNTEDEDQDDEQDYLNVPMNSQTVTTGSSAQSDTDDTDNDDDYEASYVNQPPMIHSLN